MKLLIPRTECRRSLEPYSKTRAGSASPRCLSLGVVVLGNPAFYTGLVQTILKVKGAQSDCEGLLFTQPLGSGHQHFSFPLFLVLTQGTLF